MMLNLKVHLRRRTMFEQLLCMYPIASVPTQYRDKNQPLTEGEYMIRGLRLPNHHLYQYDEEQISTGFSYIVHFLLILSNIYNVTFRYRLIYRSSRSFSCDDIVSSTMFPLFWKGVERDKFETGVILLNKNINQFKSCIGETAEIEGRGKSQQQQQKLTQSSKDNKGKGHGTLDNLKSLIDVLSPLDQNYVR